MSELQIFMKEHENWEEILSESPYFLTFSRDEHFIMAKYNQIKSDFSIQTVREARGIIFDKDTFEIVCRGFDKFGNYGESYAAEIDWSRAHVLEKIDGSLIKFWWDERAHDWNCSTNGTIDAYKAPLNDPHFDNFGDLVYSILNAMHVDNSHWNKEFTHMFELISPYNRVIITYEKPELCYLASRKNATGEECEFSGTFSLFRQPKVYALTSLKECVEAAKELGGVNEGFVVMDENYNRVKVKNPTYVAAHRMFGGDVTKSRLLDLVLSNEVAEFENYFPEYAEQIERVRIDIKAFKHEIMVITGWVKLSLSQGLSRKNLASGLKALWPNLASIGFQAADGKTEEEIFNKITAEKLKDFLGYK